MNGVGRILTFDSTKSKNESAMDVYEGEIKSGQSHGFGITTSSKEQNLGYFAEG